MGVTTGEVKEGVVLGQVVGGLSFGRWEMRV
jgi:hypothetical protein